VASSTGARAGLAVKVLAWFAAASLALAGSAAAATGGASSPAGTPTAKGSPVGTPSSVPSPGAISLLSAVTTPRKTFYYGVHYPRLRFAIGGGEALNDIRVDVANAAGEAVKTYYLNDVAPDVATSVRWDGTTASHRPARPGRYHFVVSSQNGVPTAPANVSSRPTSLSFAFYAYTFPLLGPHDFGGAAGRFGAARSGHTHQGQDIMAACGTPEVAARGGRVQYAGYEANAGNYVVIDGRGTGVDFMYAHLAEPSPLHTGDPVRTGQPIGVVGETGDAVGCHLHFEMWTAPGWYEGGSPIDPLPYLEKWDRYS
jgi:murein DD-endopeptidase MepM/ murein hydrolase activator NlpD